MLSLHDREWKEFDLRDVFPYIQRGKRLKSADHIDGNTPYVSSSAMNNGVDNFVSNEHGVRKFSDCLTLANSGSVGKTFYRSYEFVASDHVTALQSHRLNKYTDYVWEGYVPIEYRRTGTSIDFGDKEKLYPYLNIIYVQMKTDKIAIWKEKQADFWKTKPNATTTKEFFDTLAEGGWKCGACEMPRNPNPQRRIQDLKEFGYTIATDLARYCPHCGRNTSQRILLPIMRGGNEGNGYETWTPALRKRIITVLGSVDVYEDAFSPHCLPDHKFSEIRWDDERISSQWSVAAIEERSRVQKRGRFSTPVSDEETVAISTISNAAGYQMTLFDIVK